MKRILLFICLCLPFAFSLRGQETGGRNYTLLLTGASFAAPENGWFELGCAQLDAEAINRAVGGEAIADAANRMAKGTLYSPDELERIDALVIMQVHNRDVADTTQLLPSYTDYATPFDRSNYAAAFDYVIKRYQTECYNLQFNPASKYYGNQTGKPAVIILCTHWHDSRTLYNRTVRQLAAKWGLPLVEFDRYIGFSRNAPHPVTGQQPSRLYAQDTEQVDDVTYGWHPQRGQDTYIQRRMAAIFADLMRRVLPAELCAEQ